MNIAYNRDCMEGMKQFPDKYFDLAVVDPPYGLPPDSSNGRGKLKGRAFNQGNISSWDSAPPASILKSFSGFPKIKSFGAGTISIYLHAAGLLFGISSSHGITSPNANTHGQAIIPLPNYFSLTTGRAIKSIPRKSRSPCTSGFSKTMQSRDSRFLTRIWAAAPRELPPMMPGLILWAMKSGKNISTCRRSGFKTTSPR